MKNVSKVITALLLIGLVLIPATPALALDRDTDLSLADASFIGEDGMDYAGASVTGVGDVNGDGYDDFLVGAFGDEDGPGSNAGQTYLILGKASGWNMNNDLSAASASFQGEGVDDMSGSSISGVGDVNGDNYDDFIIGAYRNSETGDNAGQTYLVLGKASGWAMDTSLSAANASFRGEDEWDWAGFSVSGVGDVNGDSYDDFIIGAYLSGTGAGQTYLILGKASGWVMDYNLGSANASFCGEGYDNWSGQSVSGAGDVNGDGYDDFLIGANGYDDGPNSTVGQSYLIFGRELADWGMDYNLSAADASFQGEADADQSGWSVSGAGDINSDGYDDFLIGAKYSASGAGQAYLILGNAAANWEMGYNLSAVNASFWGEAGGDIAGYYVSDAGDANGDGFDDFLIGAPQNNDGGSLSGQAYLVFGKASGWAMDTDLSLAEASFWGEDDDDRSGQSVSGAGDVNGDGFDDILVGAPGNNYGGFSAGQSYLLLSDYARVTPYKNVVPTGDSPAIKFPAADMVLDFSACASSGFVTVEEIDGKPHRNISCGRYWSLNSSGISGFTYDITIKYTDAQIAEAGCGENELKLFINDGNGWKKHPFTPDMATNRITATGLTSMCDIAIGDGNSSLISPVSEILTIVFVAIGLIALGVFFWYRKKRKLAVAV